MTITSEVLVESDNWKVTKIYDDGEFSHYVCEYPMEKGHTSVPFNSVRASGGILSLRRNGERSCSFTGVIDGTNSYVGDDAPMPRQLFFQLKSIGPY